MSWKKEEKYLYIGAEAQFKYRGAEGLDSPSVPIGLGHQDSPNQCETAKKDDGEFRGSLARQATQTNAVNSV